MRLASKALGIFSVVLLLCGGYLGLGQAFKRRVYHLIYILLHH